MINDNNNPNLLAAIVVFICVSIWFIYQFGEMAISDIQYNIAKAKTAQSESHNTPQTQNHPSNASDANSSLPSSTTSPSRIDPVFADDFEELVVKNGAPLVLAASIESENGPATGKSDGKFLGIWVTRDWDYLTDTEKRIFVKLHVDVFSQWKGEDDGIVIVFDASDTKLASGTKYGIDLYN